MEIFIYKEEMELLEKALRDEVELFEAYESKQSS
jgi:hypothetical protein